MYELALNDSIIEKIKLESVCLLRKALQSDLVEIILYGSCARGDYTEDSDIDIALILKCNRLEAKKYNEALAGIATELAVRYFAIVNFVCIPYDEFEEKSVWYSYFHNIKTEGDVLHG